MLIVDRETWKRLPPLAKWIALAVGCRPRLALSPEAVRAAEKLGRRTRDAAERPVSP